MVFSHPPIGTVGLTEGRYLKMKVIYGFLPSTPNFRLDVSLLNLSPFWSHSILVNLLSQFQFPPYHHFKHIISPHTTLSSLTFFKLFLFELISNLKKSCRNSPEDSFITLTFLLYFFLSLHVTCAHTHLLTSVSIS